MEDDEEPINFQGIRAASKFKAKAKLAKQKVRKIRRVWKIKAFWQFECIWQLLGLDSFGEDLKNTSDLACDNELFL